MSQRFVASCVSALRAVRDLYLGSVSKFQMKPDQELVVTALLAGRAQFSLRDTGQMFLREKILCELNRNVSILIISSLKSIFEIPFAGDGTIRISYYRLLQFAGVIRRCEFRILDIFQCLTVHNRSLYELPEVTALGNLSTRVFETRTVTGSDLFSLSTCPHTTIFPLLIILSSIEMRSIKSWETIRS